MVRELANIWGNASDTSKLKGLLDYLFLNPDNISYDDNGKYKERILRMQQHIKIYNLSYSSEDTPSMYLY